MQQLGMADVKFMRMITWVPRRDERDNFNVDFNGLKNLDDFLIMSKSTFSIMTWMVLAEEGVSVGFRCMEL